MHPIMLDVAGHELTAQEREVLGHPLTGGVILFARNYQEPAQLRHLTSQIKQASSNPILIAVDQEGGRVQRLQDGMTTIPAMGLIQQAQDSAQLANDCGIVIASECLAHGVDVSFAPVLDINGCSEVIGDRSFSDNPDTVIALAEAFIAGLTHTGMAAIGKHFPGHGNVQADSHIAMPVDTRSAEDIFAHDMAIFAYLIKQERLQGMMPAHVIYPEIDTQPAGFSTVWLQNILREQLGFTGVIFSDDLSMHAATQAGDMLSRVQHALHAGVDMALICNAPDEAISVLDNLGHQPAHMAEYSAKAQRLIQVNREHIQAHHNKLQSAIYKAAQTRLLDFNIRRT